MGVLKYISKNLENTNIVLIFVKILYMNGRTIGYQPMKSNKDKIETNMEDGLYRVETSYMTAGFIVLEGKITSIAPILKKRFNYWKTIAIKIK